MLQILYQPDISQFADSQSSLVNRYIKFLLISIRLILKGLSHTLKQSCWPWSSFMAQPFKSNWIEIQASLDFRMTIYRNLFAKGSQVTNKSQSHDITIANQLAKGHVKAASSDHHRTETTKWSSTDDIKTSTSRDGTLDIQANKTNEPCQ
jgi:hypothetical protein